MLPFGNRVIHPIFLRDIRLDVINVPHPNRFCFGDYALRASVARPNSFHPFIRYALSFHAFQNFSISFLLPLTLVLSPQFNYFLPGRTPGSLSRKSFSGIISNLISLRQLVLYNLIKMSNIVSRGGRGEDGCVSARGFHLSREKQITELSSQM